MLIREELDRLLAGGVGPEENLISRLVELATSLVVQTLVEAEQTDRLGGRGRYQPRDPEVGQRGSRNGYVDGSIRAANTRARDAFATFADNGRHTSPWAAQLYRAARQRGKRHPQAVRVLMRAWARVAWTCWHTHTPYDVNRHGAEQRLAKQIAA